MNQYFVKAFCHEKPHHGIHDQHRKILYEPHFWIPTCKHENLITIPLLLCFELNPAFQKQWRPLTCSHSQFWMWLSVWALWAHPLAKSQTEAVTSTPSGHTSWTAPAGTELSCLPEREKTSVSFRLGAEVKHWAWQLKATCHTEC